MKTIKISIAFLFLLSMASCLRENLITDIEIPNVIPKPVVYGLFTPNSDSLQINLRWALPIGQANNLENDAIDNAQVWLSTTNKTDSIILPLRRRGVYSIAQKYFKLSIGQSYTVKIVIPNQKIVSTRFQIPNKAAKFYKIEYSKAIQKYGGWSRSVNKKWYDVSAMPSMLRYYTAEKSIFNDQWVVYLHDDTSQERIGDLLSEYGDIGSNLKNANHVFYLITTEKPVYDFLKNSNIMDEIIKAKNVDLLTSFKGISRSL